MKKIFLLSIILLKSLAISAMQKSEVEKKNDEIVLFDAAMKGDFERAQNLIKKGVNVNIENANGVTPLQLAVEKGDDKVIQLLISAKAQINAKNKFGYTPLTVLMSQKAFQFPKKLKILKMLLDAGADPTILTHNGESALSLYIYNEYSVWNVHLLTPQNEIINILLEHGAKPGEGRVGKLSLLNFIHRKLKNSMLENYLMHYEIRKPQR